MPYDPIDPRDELLETRVIEVSEPESDDDGLADSLGALFTMFGGQVMDPSSRD